MRHRKDKKEWVAIKIKLEKAYDRLRCEFIKDTLEDIGLLNNICTLIWHCITSSKMELLWNGEARDELTPFRGFLQGDSIFPYLFVMCIERLFHLINVAIRGKYQCGSIGFSRANINHNGSNFLVGYYSDLDLLQVQPQVDFGQWGNDPFQD